MFTASCLRIIKKAATSVSSPATSKVLSQIDVTADNSIADSSGDVNQSADDVTQSQQFNSDIRIPANWTQKGANLLNVKLHSFLTPKYESRMTELHGGMVKVRCCLYITPQIRNSPFLTSENSEGAQTVTRVTNIMPLNI